MTWVDLLVLGALCGGLSLVVVGWVVTKLGDAGLLTAKDRAYRRIGKAQRVVGAREHRISRLKRKLEDPLTLEPEAVVLKVYLDKERERLEEARREVERSRREYHELEVKELVS
jgi:hypothetical protein